MKILKAYKYRIYLNKQQQELLAKHFGCCRYIYNYALAKKIEHYTKEKKTLSRFEIQKDLVSMKIQKETDIETRSLGACPEVRHNTLGILKWLPTKIFVDQRI